MKIFSASQQKELDRYTIENEPVDSFDLMWRASERFCSHLNIQEKEYHIFCGNGNNGGDGFCIAAILWAKGIDVKVFVSESEKRSQENQKAYAIALAKIPKKNFSTFQEIKSSQYVAVDALFGIGLNRKLEGSYAKVVEEINKAYEEIIAVDTPSGLYSDRLNTPDDIIIKSTQCLTFNSPKLSFFFPEHDSYLKGWEVVDIGIHPAALERTSTKFHLNQFQSLPFDSRPKYSHKGTFGHGLLWAGSVGMFGAATLSAQSCLRSGIGKLTIFSEKEGMTILQSTCPEALFTSELKESNYQAIGIGPGIGKKETFWNIYNKLNKSYEKLPWVIDADALNQLSSVENWKELLPKNCILTPHPKELERLARRSFKDSFERMEFTRNLAKELNIVIVLKGAHTMICSPQGTYINETGNTGLATAGSGDVLTGIILGFLAQRIDALTSARLGVYLHGKTAEKAALKRKEFSIIASDLIDHIGT